MKDKLLIVTTVPETLATILRGQPLYLARFLSVSVATSPGRDLVNVAQNEKVEVFEISMVRGISPLKDLLSIIKMVRLLRELRPVIVHSYTPKAGLVTMLAARLCGSPIRIHTFTGLIFPTQSGLRRRLLIWVDRLICACATRLVPEGEGVKRDLERFGITRKKLDIIGNGNVAGVDTAYFSRQAPKLLDAALAVRSRLGIDGSDFIFCFVGRLNNDKGLHELITAFKALPRHVHLLILGAPDVTSPVDMATLDVIDTHQRVHRLGFLNDIRPALAAADILVLPSYREGFPNVVLEAGAMQLPVIATDINGSNEIIDPGMNGWLVPPHDAADLQKIMQLAIDSSPQTLQDMGKQARQRVQDRFERADHWERMLDFYRDNLARPNSSNG